MAGSRTQPEESIQSDSSFCCLPSCKSGLVGCPFGQEPGVSVVRLSEAQGRIEKGGAGELWRMDRGTTGVTTPLLYKGLLYLCKENGTILCLDALTGEQFYQERFHAQTYRGSPVAANGRIFLTARDGTFTVLKAGKIMRSLARTSSTISLPLLQSSLTIAFIFVDTVPFTPSPQ